MWNIIEQEELPSTNTRAMELLSRGEAEHGDVIQARHQTGGRGRTAGRVWNDDAGASLLMSIVLTEIPGPVHLLHYRSALAVIHALRKLSSADIFRLKWPNDILLNGKKVCGLLLEAQWNGTVMRSAVIGIGVNVKQEEFPSELCEIATSLRKEGILTEVNDLRDAVLREFEHGLHPLSTKLLIEQLHHEFVWMGTVPSLKWTATDGTEKTGLQYVSLLETGALELRTEDGQPIIVSSGSVR